MAKVVQIPDRAVPDWEKWRGILPEAATAGAAIELALKIAIDASAHIEGIGLMVNMQGPGRPRGDGGGWMRQRPDGGIEVFTGGHLGRRRVEGEDPTVEGVPIRPPPKASEG